LSLGQIVRRYGAEFLERWPQCPHVRQTFRDLALCRTEALGGHVGQCDHCGEMRYHYHSCGNRSCPQCGGSKRAAWLAKCQADLLPVPYFHVVFTLPHELSALALGNRDLMYRLLFECAKETLLEVAADPEHLGARIGVLMVLHTWGQQLEHHPHVHCVVPGGGLAVSAKARGNTPSTPADEAPRWVSCRSNWLLSVQVLGRVFRGKYLAALRAAHHAGQLRFAGSTLPLANPAAWRAVVRALYDKEWVVYAKKPFGGPDQMLKYLAGYTHRVALSNHRLVRLQDDRVTFLWKDYADGCRRKEMTLEAVEFLRRFALHIVPRGLVRIRQYGILAHRDRGQRLALCRSLLAAEAGPTTAPGNETTTRPTDKFAGRIPSQDSATLGSSPVEAKPVTSSRLNMGLLAALISLGVSSGTTADLTTSASGASAAVAADDRCPHCGLGLVQTIWHASRPGREERQRIPILDSS
jgi:hypothetical protein